MPRLFRHSGILAGLTMAVVTAAAFLVVPSAHAAVVTNCTTAAPTAGDAAFAAKVKPTLTNKMAVGLDAGSAACVRVIVAAVKARNLPVRAASIAITTAIVESSIRNLDYGDRDSLGLYQQRPSQGWGTEAEILDPVHSTNSFLNKMVKYPNGSASDEWKTGDIGEICQFVQVSAFPGRYSVEAADGARIAEAAWHWVSEGGDRSYYNGSQDHHYERGADNTLVHWWYTDKWNQAILPGTITSDPVAYYANGQDHVYGRNASGGLQHWWYAGGQWNTANLGGAITGAPTAFYANGQDHAFARTTEGTLYHWWYVSGSGWQKADLGGAITGSPTGYAGGNQQHVYARTTAGTLYHWWYVPGSGWQKADLGGAITNSPSGYRADNGQDHVYARTTAGTLYHWWYVPGTGWKTANLGGAITDSPTAYYAGGQDHVYARTTAGTLYHWWYVPGSGWNTSDLGGAITGSPSGYRAETNQQDHAYAKTTNGTLQHWWYVPGTGWKTANLGGNL